MRILFACGGTAGHINPALAVAETIRREHPEAEFLFAGNPAGMEARLVPKAGFAFAPIEIQGFQRQISWRNIRYNFRSALCLLRATGRAREIIDAFGPDAVMGTGGYVSGPLLRTAAKMGVKTLTHEQNAFPGVTTKLLVKHVDKVLLAVEEAKGYLPKNKTYIITGNPVREEILFTDRARARERLGVGGRTCLLSFGGSLGARRLNEAVADLMAWHCEQGSIHHIHATGQYGVELFPRLLRERGVEPERYRHLDIREYIDDMPDCLAAADLVICRAGALTLSELMAAGRASILIPSPNVAENHQYHNARVLSSKNAALLIEERDLTGLQLCKEVEQLVNDPQELGNIGKNARSLAVIDANSRICRELYALIGR